MSDEEQVQTYDPTAEFPPKEAWGPGPWTDEPDREEWLDPDTGYPCLARRAPGLGHWCGYVAVEPGHPLHEVPCWDDQVQRLDVPVGVNFSAFCDDEAPPEANPVCHVPQPGRPGDVWWFGFGLGGGCDYSPGLHASIGLAMRAYDHERTLAQLLSPPGPDEPVYESAYRRLGGTYKTIGYVRERCRELAAALREAHGGQR